MLKPTAIIALLSLFAVARPDPISAQTRSGVTAADIESAVLAAPEADRVEVQDFLRNDQVLATAARLGVSATDLATRVNTMDDATLSRVAERTRDAHRDLAGGNETIVISATTVIIALLILILLT